MVCAKTKVLVILLTENKVWYGTNKCGNPQKTCPRLSGEGYEKCKSICKQRCHAEIDVCDQAKEEGRNGTMFIIGHTRICDECEEETKKYNIKVKFCDK